MINTNKKLTLDSVLTLVSTFSKILLSILDSYLPLKKEEILMDLLRYLRTSEIVKHTEIHILFSDLPAQQTVCEGDPQRNPGNDPNPFGQCKDNLPNEAPTDPMCNADIFRAPQKPFRQRVHLISEIHTNSLPRF